MAIRLERSRDMGGSLHEVVGRIEQVERWIREVYLASPVLRGMAGAGSLSAALLRRGVQAYRTSAQFTTPAWDGVAWQAFYILFADGTRESLDAGSITALNDNPYYLFWLNGESALQNTQAYDEVLGEERALVAIVQRPPAAHNPTTQKPFVHTFTGLGEAVHSGVISANAILADHIQALSITTGKIAAGAVETEKLAAGAVIAAKIAAGAVETTKLDAGAVTSDKITSGQIIAKDFRTAENVGEVGGPAGIRFNANEIAGYSGGATKEFYLEAASGKGYFGGGAGWLDGSGLTI
ncbi:hypothetical protein COT29_04475, partial [Candidatus Micrarchaeota archaeon CG08_land_8_20_14_0_20_59_11]